MYQPCTSTTVNYGEQRSLTVTRKQALSRPNGGLPGVSSSTAHNPKVAGSNPAPATRWKARKQCVCGLSAFSGEVGVYRVDLPLRVVATL